MPTELCGLSLDDFAHPDDVKAVQSLLKVQAIDKLLTAVVDKSNQMYVRMTTLGSCVRVTEQYYPKLIGSVKRVCEILDYNKMPEVYLHRSFEMDVEPRGIDNPVLVIPDFAVNNFDESIMYFSIGRAVTRLKSDHLKFYLAASMIIKATDSLPFASDAVKVSLSNWMRKSELTADRGGLLACQNFSAATRFLMCKAGMPINESKDIKIHEYIEACKFDSELAKVGKTVQTLKNATGWSNDRISELFIWNAQGHYGDILDKYAE